MDHRQTFERFAFEEPIGMSITDLELVAKSGGRSGEFRREEPA
jgi:hypothetical protein